MLRSDEASKSAAELQLHSGTHEIPVQFQRNTEVAADQRALQTKTSVQQLSVQSQQQIQKRDELDHKKLVAVVKSSQLDELSIANSEQTNIVKNLEPGLQLVSPITISLSSYPYVQAEDQQAIAHSNPTQHTVSRYSSMGVIQKELLNQQMTIASQPACGHGEIQAEILNKYNTMASQAAIGQFEIKSEQKNEQMTIASQPVVCQDKIKPESLNGQLTIASQPAIGQYDLKLESYNAKMTIASQPAIVQVEFVIQQQNDQTIASETALQQQQIQEYKGEYNIEVNSTIKTVICEERKQQESEKDLQILELQSDYTLKAQVQQRQVHSNGPINVSFDSSLNHQATSQKEIQHSSALGPSQSHQEILSKHKILQGAEKQMEPQTTNNKEQSPNKEMQQNQVKGVQKSLSSFSQKEKPGDSLFNPNQTGSSITSQQIKRSLENFKNIVADQEDDLYQSAIIENDQIPKINIENVKSCSNFAGDIETGVVTIADKPVAESQWSGHSSSSPQKTQSARERPNMQQQFSEEPSSQHQQESILGAQSLSSHTPSQNDILLVSIDRKQKQTSVYEQVVHEEATLSEDTPRYLTVNKNSTERFIQEPTPALSEQVLSKLQTVQPVQDQNSLQQLNQKTENQEYYLNESKSQVDYEVKISQKYSKESPYNNQNSESNFKVKFAIGNELALLYQTERNESQNSEMEQHLSQQISQIEQNRKLCKNDEDQIKKQADGLVYRISEQQKTLDQDEKQFENKKSQDFSVILSHQSSTSKLAAQIIEKSEISDQNEKQIEKQNSQIILDTPSHQPSTSNLAAEIIEKSQISDQDVKQIEQNSLKILDIPSHQQNTSKPVVQIIEKSQISDQDVKQIEQQNSLNISITPSHQPTTSKPVVEIIEKSEISDQEAKQIEKQNSQIILDTSSHQPNTSKLVVEIIEKSEISDQDVKQIVKQNSQNISITPSHQPSISKQAAEIIEKSEISDQEVKQIVKQNSKNISITLLHQPSTSKLAAEVIEKSEISDNEKQQIDKENSQKILVNPARQPSFPQIEAQENFEQQKFVDQDEKQIQKQNSQNFQVIPSRQQNVSQLAAKIMEPSEILDKDEKQIEEQKSQNFSITPSRQQSVQLKSAEIFEQSKTLDQSEKLIEILRVSNSQNISIAISNNPNVKISLKQVTQDSTISESGKQNCGKINSQIKLSEYCDDFVNKNITFASNPILIQVNTRETDQKELAVTADDQPQVNENIQFLKMGQTSCVNRGKVNKLRFMFTNKKQETAIDQSKIDVQNKRATTAQTDAKSGETWNETSAATFKSYLNQGRSLTESAKKSILILQNKIISSHRERQQNLSPIDHEVISPSNFNNKAEGKKSFSIVEHRDRVNLSVRNMSTNFSSLRGKQKRTETSQISQKDYAKFMMAAYELAYSGISQEEQSKCTIPQIFDKMSTNLKVKNQTPIELLLFNSQQRPSTQINQSFGSTRGTRQSKLDEFSNKNFLMVSNPWPGQLQTRKNPNFSDRRFSEVQAHTTRPRKMPEILQRPCLQQKRLSPLRNNFLDDEVKQKQVLDQFIKEQEKIIDFGNTKLFRKVFGGQYYQPASQEPPQLDLLTICELDHLENQIRNNQLRPELFNEIFARVLKNLKELMADIGLAQRYRQMESEELLNVTTPTLGRLAVLVNRARKVQRAHKDLNQIFVLIAQYEVRHPELKNLLIENLSEARLQNNQFRNDLQSQKLKYKSLVIKIIQSVKQLQKNYKFLNHIFVVNERDYLKRVAQELSEIQKLTMVYDVTLS